MATLKEHLSKCEPKFGLLVELIINDLIRKGYSPRIVFSYRTPEQQLELFNKKASKLKIGYHNFTTKDGKPCSEAVDIIDSRFGWNNSKDAMKFFEDMASIAAMYGVISGHYWKSFPDSAHLQSTREDKRCQR